jgi:hypothetical protein
LFARFSTQHFQLKLIRLEVIGCSSARTNKATALENLKSSIEFYIYSSKTDWDFGAENIIKIATIYFIQTCIS